MKKNVSKRFACHGYNYFFFTLKVSTMNQLTNVSVNIVENCVLNIKSYGMLRQGDLAKDKLQNVIIKK